MDADKLQNWVNEAGTHQKIVGDYSGSYTLGVTDSPPSFLLRVEPEDVGKFPDRVTIHGVDVPVVVHGGFARPRPLA